jgi:UDP-N-acetylglucosamine--N-acetylmuramyl-(pentapeptide) pyrophosphoryl-undecaprenol N-acetylglucosamine transferase
MPAVAPVHRLDGHRRVPARRPPHASPCFVFAGGGTGGHLFPGLAVAAELRERVRRASIVFAGTGRDWERHCVEQAGFDYVRVPSHPLPRTPVQLLRSVSANLAGYRQMMGWLDRRGARAVIGLGGYSGFPTVLAALRRGIPTFLLEQNLIPGKATRWLARCAEAVFSAFDETQAMLNAKARVRCTGNPMRAEIVRLWSQRIEPAAERRTLLITGGSQGAQSLNRAVLAALAQLELCDRWRIIHQTGPRDYGSVVRQYAQLGIFATVRPFFPEMAPLYQQADLAVCRGGATTLSELACAGLPAVVLPYPHAAADHQTANARWYERHGAVVSVRDQPDAVQTIADLSHALHVFTTDAERLRESSRCMQRLARPNAASDVATQVLMSMRVAT